MASQAWRRTIGAGGLAVALAAGGYPAVSNAATAAAPPPMTFTANVRADIAEKAVDGQSEPQLAVDEAGQTFVSWAGGPGGWAISKTTDGKTFTLLPNPNAISMTNGDVTLATSSWSSPTETQPVRPGTNTLFWSALGQLSCGVFEMVGATSTDSGKSFAASNPGCVPGQVDRPWLAAYTPQQYRGTKDAPAHTWLYVYFHVFSPDGLVYIMRSSDGGTTWDPVTYPAIQPGSVQLLTTTCNTTPGTITVDQRGPHAGRIYVSWATSDLVTNYSQGCNYTQAEAFDHFFFSYSDDNGMTWTSGTIFNDPCAPSPPVPPTDQTKCNDTAEFWNWITSDDAGNVYAAYPWRDPSAKAPGYDLYVATAPVTSGTVAFNPPVKTNSRPGTYYSPSIVAGAKGMVDVAAYETDYIEGTAQFGKPAAAPPTAVWNVQLMQSLDVGRTWTESQVTDHPNYFGDYCTTGIFCGLAPAQFNWGQDRILFEDFALGFGPDGGARLAWTDTRDSWKGACVPAASSTVGCQRSHIYFACQQSGMGLHGEAVTGCGQSQAQGTTVMAPTSTPTATPSPVTPTPLPNTGGLGGWMWAAGAGVPIALVLVLAARHRRLAAQLTRLT